ncbi:hypothetical protein N658DRAFT_505699 [Parathielavia hyrcaniae]|uniref:NACHT domain-containing protein n=1 Tax=Parathielavia hyrcaniae TaxID=113614 RepID=A0AAN6Q9E7_9PEZI|nr:hypothetical protein N658DRAFT_505699 [Parathielavia hyrcaniae]
MDPVSLSLGIAGLLPLIAKTIQGAKDYRDAVVSSQDTIAALISELEALQLNVDSLYRFLKDDDSLSSSSLRFSQTSVLLSCSSACKAKLQSLCKTLGQQDNGRRSRYLWPFSEKEHQKTVQQIRNFSHWMHFALSVDGCRLLSQTSDDVLKVLGQQLEQFRAIESLQDTTGRIYDTVQAQKSMMEDSLAQDTRTQILEWISTINYGQKHQTLQATRAKDTGHWILRTSEYTRWRGGQEQDQSNVLWCHGIQGSGKTNLASIIIDDLFSQNSTSGTASPVAFFYFDHQDRASQSSLNVFSCILRQFLDQLPTIPASISSLYNHTHLRRQLSQLDCEMLLTELARELGYAYLVIDALDECSSDERASVLDTLKHLDRCPGLRLLLTSRPHTQDIASALAHHPRLTITARDEDIRAYIHQELHRSGVYGIADESFVRELVHKLTQAADGMFLLPVLQLRSVLKEPTLGEMEDSLNNLSHSLNEAFGATISRIQSLPASRSRIGMESLMYLTYAARPLTVHELSDLLATRSGSNCGNNAKYRPPESMILQCCQGLIAIDSTTEVVRVAHHSIQEYLAGNSPHLFPRANARFAVTCLSPLLSEDLRAGPWEAQDEIDRRLTDRPFLAYAAEFWGTYAKHSEQDPEVHTLLTDLFSSTSAMATANQVRQYSMGRREEYWGAEECLSLTPLHFACRHGLTRTVVELLDRGVFDVNVRTKQGATPIIHAAANGHDDIVRFLMRRGADPYLCNWYGNALHCAVECESAEAVRELVVWGMDPIHSPPGSREYLSCALDNDSADVFMLLVELGSCQGDRALLEPLFFEACSSGCAHIAELMLERGWVDMKDFSSPTGQRALYLADERGDLVLLMKMVMAMLKRQAGSSVRPAPKKPDWHM